MIVVDTNFLITLIKGDEQDLSYTHVKKVIDFINTSSRTLAIPTIVFAELLVGLNIKEREKIERYLTSKFSTFKMLPFDKKSAIESAFIYDKVKDKQVNAQSSRQKLKVDRQIIAIALANNATMLITSDDDLHKFASHIGSANLKVKTPDDIDFIRSPSQVDFLNDLSSY